MPRLLLPGGWIGADLLVLDKDGVLLDFHRLWVAIARARAEAITALIQEPAWASGLLAAWGVDAEGRVSGHGVLATGTRAEAVVVAATWLHGRGLPWTRAREASALGFETGEAACRSLLPGPPLPGVGEALAALCGAGWRLALATSDESPSAERFLTALGVRDAFGAVVGADRVPVSKPDPAMFLMACDQVGVEPHRAVMVGDARVDMELGRRAGAAATVGVLSGVGDAASLAPEADLLVPDLLALLELTAD